MKTNIRITIFFILFFILAIEIYAQSLDGLIFSTGQDGPSPDISFKNNTVTLYFPEDVIRNGQKYIGLKEIKNASYSYKIINGIYHISIQSNPNIELYLLFNNEFGYFSITSPVENKYDSGLLLRVTDELIPRLPRGGGDSWLYDVSQFSNSVIRASSAFRENGITYAADNLRYLFTTRPWVEGKNDAGIGEYVELDFSISGLGPGHAGEPDIIVISNGFFSPNNPNLYFRNNRVKRIRIEDVNGSYKEEFEVQDTPNIQSFKLKGTYSRLKITILDVYRGTDYNDTCINYLTVVRLNIKKL